MNIPKVWVIAWILWLGSLSSAAAATPADPKVLHVLNRLGFGPRPGDVQKVEAMGVDQYIQQQLHPDSIPEPRSLTDRLSQLETLTLSPATLLSQYRPQRLQKRQTQQGQPQTELKGQTPPLATQKANRAIPRRVMEQAVAARLLRAIDSPRQLQEVMVDFWYNHFNVFAGKGLDRLLVGAYEQAAIRPYALGHFRDLLEATAHHPAMLFYLDNWQNTAPQSPGARGRFQGLNENYARELMELHTLGVEGGYTQADVITLARILTGWGFRRPAQRTAQAPLTSALRSPRSDSSNSFYFDPKRHDFSDKVFLGHPIKGSGVAEGEQALDILARSPATARHISYELAQYFVADQPSKALVDRLTQRFLATDGDIRAVLDTLFHSSEFWNSQSLGTKFKTPYEYVVSAVRATGSEVTNVRPLYSVLQQLGMPLYGCQTPDGYKNTQESWLNPEAMTRRISFATALASGRLPLAGASGDPANAKTQSSDVPIRPGAALPTIDPDQLADTLGDRFSEKTQRALATSPVQLRAALMLGSPEFMHR